MPNTQIPEAKKDKSHAALDGFREHQATSAVEKKFGWWIQRVIAALLLSFLGIPVFPLIRYSRGSPLFCCVESQNCLR